MDFTYSRKINYYETDKMGVVHHSNYIRFLEESRCAWLEANNLPMRRVEELGYTIPVLEVNCKYKNHVTHEDEILITPHMEEYNGVKMKIRYDVIEKITGKTVIEAYSMHCFTTHALKPVNMKKHSLEIHNVFHSLLEK